MRCSPPPPVARFAHRACGESMVCRGGAVILSWRLVSIPRFFRDFFDDAADTDVDEEHPVELVAPPRSIPRLPHRSSNAPPPFFPSSLAPSPCAFVYTGSSTLTFSPFFFLDGPARPLATLSCFLPSFLPRPTFLSFLFLPSCIFSSFSRLVLLFFCVVSCSSSRSVSPPPPFGSFFRLLFPHRLVNPPSSSLLFCPRLPSFPRMCVLTVLIVLSSSTRSCSCSPRARH